METQKSEGKCLLCGAELEKNTVSRHLKLCAKADAATDKAAGKLKIKTFHISVEGLHLPEYWLHLSIPAGAKLEALDGFLRRIWLECCGHLSALTAPGRRRAGSATCARRNTNAGKICCCRS